MDFNSPDASLDKGEGSWSGIGAKSESVRTVESVVMLAASNAENQQDVKCKYLCTISVLERRTHTACV